MACACTARVVPRFASGKPSALPRVNSQPPDLRRRPIQISDAGQATQRSLLELIVQTAPDAIITADAHGVILSFSPAAERIFGYGEAEVVGRNVSLLMPDPYRASHDGYMERYLDTRDPHVIGIGREVRAQRKSGDIFAAELALGELVLDEERIFTGFIRDVSDRVDAEQRAQALQHTLSKLDRLKMLGEMSSALAHEINQPLAAISNFARAARRTLDHEVPDLDALRDYVQAISEQSVRAGEILRRMRQMVERGHTNTVPDDINDIIREAIDIGRSSSEHFGPEVVLDLQDSLPPVEVDRIQIQQVVLNLMTNAVEAMGQANPQPVQVRSGMVTNDGRIEVRAGSNHREVTVTVSDTGPGIAHELAEQVFDPLVSTKEAGLGVGLAICRTIIEAHKGRIWAENLDGGGAAFHFTVPAVDA